MVRRITNQATTKTRRISVSFTLSKIKIKEFMPEADLDEDVEIVGIIWQHGKTYGKKIR
jgi:hypothetical protein